MDTDVIVVGAGPVGLLLAGELRLAGADVVVVERLSEPTGESRAAQWNAATIEMFDRRGLLDGVAPVPREHAGHFAGLPLDFHATGGNGKVSQPRTESMLGEWASGLGVDIRRGRTLVDLSQDDGGVAAVVSDSDGLATLHCRYLVGCDGERSTVRGLAGIDMAGTPARRELIRADVTGIDIPPRRFERRERGMAIAGRTGGGVTRVMLHEFGRRAADRATPADFAEVAASWVRITGEDIRHGTPVWVDAFSDAGQQAVRYRAGRVLLAGDAAHVLMPTSGQALNIGLQDATNLGWKLATVARGRSGVDLLDTYHDERHPVAARLLRYVRAQTDLLLGDTAINPLRDLFAELIAIHDVHRHLVDTLSGTDVRYGPVDRPLPAGLRTAAMSRDGRGVLLDLSGQHRARTVADEWATWVRVIEATVDSPSFGAALVRPDGHIAWIDGSIEDLRTALRRWFGSPVRN